MTKRKVYVACDFQAISTLYTVQYTVQELNSCWDGRPFGHNRHGPKSGRLLCPLIFWRGRGAWHPSNTMSPGPRPASIPCGILIHPLATIHQTYRHRQRSDSIERTVLQTVSQKVMASRKRCNRETLLLETTNKNWCMAYKTVPLLMTFNERQDHFPAASIFKCNLLYGTWQYFKWFRASRGPSVIA